MFLTLALTGLRRSELQRLHWTDIDLLEGVLRVREGKSEEGERSIALPPRLQTELSEHYRKTAYRGQDELVFCHRDRGTVYRAEPSRRRWRPPSRRLASRASYAPSTTFAIRR